MCRRKSEGQIRRVKQTFEGPSMMHPDLRFRSSLRLIFLVPALSLLLAVPEAGGIGAAEVGMAQGLGHTFEAQTRPVRSEGAAPLRQGETSSLTRICEKMPIPTWCLSTASVSSENGIPSGSLTGSGYKVESKTFPKSAAILGIASINSTALLQLSLPSGKWTIGLFNATLNSSKTLQGVVPGGNQTFAVDEISGGGAFFVAWLNTSTESEFWQKVTVAGKVANIRLPIGKSLPWSFDYGNGTSLFASAENFLVDINPTSLKIIANYTSSLPRNTSVSAVLPDGQRLYLAGVRSLADGATYPYFGYLNLTSKKVTTISKTVKSYPSDFYGGFFTLISRGSDIYVGGGLSIYSSSPFVDRAAAGYFYRFAPSSASFKNLSSLLPSSQWVIGELEPWADTISLSLFDYNFSNTTFLWEAAIYTLSSNGHSLVNQTAQLPKGFWGNNATNDGESASAGWFFQEGYLLSVPAVVAIST